ncbi:hypothetical protein F5Y14DRAFT_451181 [Nemania sp. NC0429]|nr:hypothetical protein F5Y14DRAFT_451181 [Nemania sp. NC0429]
MGSERALNKAEKWFMRLIDEGRNGDVALDLSRTPNKALFEKSDGTGIEQGLYWETTTAEKDVEVGAAAPQSRSRPWSRPCPSTTHAMFHEGQSLGSRFDNLIMGFDAFVPYSTARQQVVELNSNQLTGGAVGPSLEAQIIAAECAARLKSKRCRKACNRLRYIASRPSSDSLFEEANKDEDKDEGKDDDKDEGKDEDKDNGKDGEDDEDAADLSSSSDEADGKTGKSNGANNKKKKNKKKGKDKKKKSRSKK